MCFKIRFLISRLCHQIFFLLCEILKTKITSFSAVLPWSAGSSFLKDLEVLGFSQMTAEVIFWISWLVHLYLQEHIYYSPMESKLLFEKYGYDATIESFKISNCSLDQFDIAFQRASQWCSLSNSFFGFNSLHICLNWEAFIFSD